MPRQYLEDVLRSELDWPSLREIESGSVIVDPSIHDSLIEKVRTQQLCALTGPEGSGKTSLSRVVAHEFMSSGMTTFHIDLGDHLDHDVDELIPDFKMLDHTEPFYLVENLHSLRNPRSVSKLIDAMCMTEASSFLITERVLDRERSWAREIVSFYVDPDEGSAEVHLEPGLHFVDQIVRVVAMDVGTSREMPTLLQTEKLWRRCHGNLRTLRAYLDAWEAGSIDSLREHVFLESMYRQRLLSLRDGPRRVLVSLSAVGMWDLPVMAEVWGPEVDELVQDRILARTEGGEYVKLAHSSDGRINVSSWCHHRELDKEEFISERLVRYINHQPIPRNALDLLWLVRRRERIRSAVSGTEGMQRIINEQVASIRQHPTINELIKLIGALDQSPALSKAAWLQLSAGGTEWIGHVIRQANSHEVSLILRFVRQSDRKRARDLDDSLTSRDWAEIWSRLPLKEFTGHIVYWREKYPDVAVLALKSKLLHPDFPAELRGQGYALTGRLLQVGRLLASPDLRKLGEAVAANLAILERGAPDKLTLVLYELWAGRNETARDVLLERMVGGLSLQWFLRDQSGRGAAFFVYYVAMSKSFTAQAKEEVLRSSIEANVAEAVKTWDGLAFATYIWGAILIDEDMAKELLSELPTQSLIEISVRTDRAEDLFRCVWNTYQLDQEKGRAILASTIGSMKLNEPMIDPHMIPLLGLAAHARVVPNHKLHLRSANHVILELLRRPSGSTLLFALICFREFAPSQFKEMSSAITAQLEENGVRDHREYYTSHPIPRIKQLLQTIHASVIDSHIDE